MFEGIAAWFHLWDSVLRGSSPRTWGTLEQMVKGKQCVSLGAVEPQAGQFVTGATRQRLGEPIAAQPMIVNYWRIEPVPKRFQVTADRRHGHFKLPFEVFGGNRTIGAKQAVYFVIPLYRVHPFHLVAQRRGYYV